MPVLPQKRNAVTGNKKSGDELQHELVEYMHELLKIDKLQRMLYLRLFLSQNTYPGLEAEESGVSLMTLDPSQPLMSPAAGRAMHNPSDRALVRES